jgi:tRNA-intron endonuclease
LVFKDLRQKGYVVKTALKFGAEFRIYEKGSKPGNKHAKWIVFAEHESKKLSWHEFSAKNRVAHSTKKNLLLAIVDEEADITYYEVKWLKP